MSKYTSFTKLKHLIFRNEGSICLIIQHNLKLHETAAVDRKMKTKTVASSIAGVDIRTAALYCYDLP
jgi:hypothetical protein